MMRRLLSRWSRLLSPALSAVTGRLLLPAGLLSLSLPLLAAEQPAHSRAELNAQIAKLQDLVRACSADAGACRAEAVPDDEVVGAEGAQPKFILRWDWLRNALDTAAKAKPDEAEDGAAKPTGSKPAGTRRDLGKERREAMGTSAARLEELARQTGGEASGAAGRAEFAQARRTTDDVLSGVEFDGAAPPSLWDRWMAKFWAMVGRLFQSAGRLGQRAPWLGRVMEWLLFGGAAVALLFFLRRNFQRQRLAASLRGEQAALTGWDREATDWAALADRAAEGGDWREAVHCLYWAAIVRLESRRAWRHNPARTPREYVRLLKPGSVQRESLGGLTGLLERVWYGLRPAGADEYRSARTWFERLSEGAGATGLPAGSERA